MNNIVQKILSLTLLILITLLTFDYFKVIEFEKSLSEAFSFIIVIFAIVSAMGVILSSAPGIMKFINFVILFTLTVGGLLFIYKNTLNMFLIIFILFTVTYSLIDMLYKK